MREYNIVRKIRRTEVGPLGPGRVWIKAQKVSRKKNFNKEGGSSWWHLCPEPDPLCEGSCWNLGMQGHGDWWWWQLQSRRPLPRDSVVEGSSRGGGLCWRQSAEVSVLLREGATDQKLFWSWVDKRSTRAADGLLHQILAGWRPPEISWIAVSPASLVSGQAW